MNQSNLQSVANRETYPKRVDISATPVAHIILKDTMKGVKMKKIPLTQGQFALVDDDDFDELNKYKWYANKPAHGGFVAVRNITIANKQTLLYMHRVIMNAPPNKQVDHRNHHTLDNQKHNLRLCTHRQNQHNRLPQNGASKYKGACWQKQSKKWTAQIQFNGKNHYLGCFDDEIEAAKAYDRKAKEYFGEFCYLNFLETDAPDG